MKIFHVVTEATVEVTRYYQIEAESLEEAKKLWIEDRDEYVEDEERGSIIDEYVATFEEAE